MADENNVDNQSLAKLSISNENVEAALMLLAETIVDHRNTMVTLAEETKKKSNPAEQVKQPRNPLTALSRNLHGLVKELKNNNKSDETSNIMRSLNVNLSTMQAGIQSLINSNKALVDSQRKKAEADAKLATKQADSEKKKSREERLEKENNKVSYFVNKQLRRNPWIRYMSPKLAPRIQKFAGFADFTRQAGLPGLGAGKLAASASRGSLAALGGIGALVGLFALLKTVIKRGAEDMSQAYKLEGLSGGTYTTKQAEMFRSSAGLLGLDGKAAFQKQQEYYRHGVRSDVAVLQGYQAEKYYGASNVASYFQKLLRSTDYAQKQTYNLGKAFANLNVIMKTTNMGMDEVIQHQTGLMDAYNGQTYAFKHSETTALLTNFKDLINSYELSGSKLGDILSSSQKVDSETLTQRAYFAKMGGYQFKNNDLLSQAYELRRMGSGDLQSQLKMMQATIKGQLKMFGVEKFSQLSEQQKWMVTEKTLPMAGVNVANMPSADKFIERLSKGTENLGLNSKLAQELKDAQTTDVEKIVGSMALLENPLMSIKELLFKAVMDRSEARRYAEKQMGIEDEKRLREEKGAEVNVNIFDDLEAPVKIKATTPGGRGKVNIKEVQR